MGSAFVVFNLGEVEVPIDRNKPGQGRKAVAVACKDRGWVEAGRGNHNWECRKKCGEVKRVQGVA